MAGLRQAAQSGCPFSAYPGISSAGCAPPNLIESCFVEVWRRARPMVCFVNAQSVDRIICSIFQRSTWNGKTAPSAFIRKQLDVT